MRGVCRGLLALACAWLYAGEGRAASPVPRAASKPNVVLVHGIWRDGRVFDLMIRTLKKDGYTCYAPSLTPNDCRLGIRDLTHKLAAGIDARFGPRVPIVLIGFSMGGIITRDYVENVVPDRRRVRGVFLIASGGKGTLLANLSPGKGQRDMAVGSPFLRALNADNTAWRTVPIHAYWTPLDLMVIPSANSRWPEDRSTRVVCALHPWMLRDRRVIADLATRLKTM